MLRYICDQTIERLVGKLKQFRRGATRYDKLDVHYLAFVQYAPLVTRPNPRKVRESDISGESPVRVAC